MARFNRTLAKSLRKFFSDSDFQKKDGNAQ